LAAKKLVKGLKWWRPASALAVVLASISLAISIWNTTRRNPTTPGSSPNLSIADLVSAVKKQLNITRREAHRAQEDYLFYTRQLDLELNFVVTRSIGGNGGVKIGVVEASSSGTYEDSQIQKVHLTFDTLLSNDALNYYALSNGFASAEDPGFRTWFSQILKNGPIAGPCM